MTSTEHLTLAVRASGFFTILLPLYTFVPQAIAGKGWEGSQYPIFVFFLLTGLFLLRFGHWVTAFATGGERRNKTAS